MTTIQPIWLIFGAVVVAVLAVDLTVIARKTLSIKDAARWSGIVIATALLFGLAVLWQLGSKSALEYYAGYLIELTLSVDNLFVFLLIFDYFAVPAGAQRRVLSWGIFGAMVLRGLMIAVGAAVIGRFEWVIYLLGVLLLYTAVKMLRDDDVRLEPERNPLVRLTRRLVRMTAAFENDRFFVKTHAGWFATPLLLVVVIVNWTDVVFAIDSVPAIFAVTRDTFIVFSSNVLAIVGLRALFFVLADLMNRFAYLKPGVAIILGFVGFKMVLSYWLHLSVGLSLGVIVSVLVISVVLSIVKLKAAPRD